MFNHFDSVRALMLGASASLTTTISVILESNEYTIVGIMVAGTATLWAALLAIWSKLEKSWKERAERDQKRIDELVNENKNLRDRLDNRKES